MAANIQTDVMTKDRPRVSWYEPDRTQHAGSRRKADGAQELPDVGARLGFRQQSHAHDIDERGPCQPSDERRGCTDQQTARAEAAHTQATCDAGQCHHQKGLGCCTRVGFDFFVHGDIEPKCPEKPLRKCAHGNHACGFGLAADRRYNM